MHVNFTFSLRWCGKVHSALPFTFPSGPLFGTPFRPSYDGGGGGRIQRGRRAWNFQDDSATHSLTHCVKKRPFSTVQGDTQELKLSIFESLSSPNCEAFLSPFVQQFENVRSSTSKRNLDCAWDFFRFTNPIRRPCTYWRKKRNKDRFIFRFIQNFILLNEKTLISQGKIWTWTPPEYF